MVPDKYLVNEVINFEIPGVKVSQALFMMTVFMH